MTNEGSSIGSGPLDEAAEHLKDAEVRLEHAREDEAKADHDIKVAIKEIEEAEHKHKDVEVHVMHVNEVEKASFKEPISATLRQVWDKSYIELKIARKPKDIFQTGGPKPKPLMSFLELSLEQARDQKVIDDFHFGIASETGGA
jgi:hypothetical protein